MLKKNYIYFKQKSKFSAIIKYIVLSLDRINLYILYVVIY